MAKAPPRVVQGKGKLPPGGKDRNEGNSSDGEFEEGSLRSSQVSKARTMLYLIPIIYWFCKSVLFVCPTGQEQATGFPFRLRPKFANTFHELFSPCLCFCLSASRLSAVMCLFLFDDMGSAHKEA
jgi:hypothetical protein